MLKQSCNKTNGCIKRNRTCECMSVCVRMNMQFVASGNFAFNFLTFPRDFLNT